MQHFQKYSLVTPSVIGRALFSRIWLRCWAKLKLISSWVNWNETRKSQTQHTTFLRTGDTLMKNHFFSHHFRILFLNFSCRIIQPHSSIVLQGCEDDGEFGAGARMLHLLQVCITSSTQEIALFCLLFCDCIDCGCKERVGGGYTMVRRCSSRSRSLQAHQQLGSNHAWSSRLLERTKRQ